MIGALPAALRQAFVLTGGTALAAFYLQHWLSDDLDFFARELAQPVRFSEIGAGLSARLRVLTSERIYDRCLFVVEAAGETVKVEFAPLYFARLHPGEKRSGVFVDSLEDIAANEVLALADRFDPKDFVDVYCLCQRRGWSILDLVAIARRKHDAPYEYSLRLSRIVEQAPSLAAVRLVRPLAAEEVLEFFRSAEAQLVRAQQARLEGCLPPPSSS